MIPGIVENQIVGPVMATAWSYLGTTGTHTHTTSYANDLSGCPSRTKAQSYLPAASGYLIGNVIRQATYDDTFAFCSYYYYQAT